MPPLRFWIGFRGTLIPVRNPNLAHFEQAAFQTDGLLSTIVNTPNINELVFRLAGGVLSEAPFIQKFGNEFKFSDLLIL
jgi:hypothetical protein